MNQPPPHGWYQQPPPPPGWPQPPKKNRAPLVAGVIAGVLVLGAAATFGFLYLSANTDGGSPRRGGTMPEMCANVSEAALAKARTTNSNPVLSRETKYQDHTSTSCSWDQTRGRDGSGLRTLDVHVFEGDDAGSEYEQRLSRSKQNNQGTISERKLDGLGDEAAAVLVDTRSAFLHIDIIVRKGDKVFELGYAGWDAGLFGNERPDVTEFEEAARGVAEALLSQA